MPARAYSSLRALAGPVIVLLGEGGLELQLQILPELQLQILPGSPQGLALSVAKQRSTISQRVDSRFDGRYW